MLGKQPGAVGLHLLPKLGSRLQIKNKGHPKQNGSGWQGNCVLIQSSGSEILSKKEKRKQVEKQCLHGWHQCRRSRGGRERGVP